MTVGTKVEFKLVGMSFLHQLPYGAQYPEDFVHLHELMEASKVESLGWVVGEALGANKDYGFPPIPEGPLELTYFRNPDNEFDANAIEVHAPILGRRSMLGHVPASLAAEVAPSMDAGDEWTILLETVLIDPEYPDKPGALISLTR